MSAVFIAGSIITIASKNILLFSVSRFVAGFGFGGVLLSTSSLVIKYTSQRTRSAGYGTNAAAFASASRSLLCSLMPKKPMICDAMKRTPQMIAITG